MRRHTRTLLIPLVCAPAPAGAGSRADRRQTEEKKKKKPQQNTALWRTTEVTQCHGQLNIER
ncbi:hypothetical protein J6590_004360 [Homalodisca vitripennis]|nr:hypothetical protein J6590_004360 [Homalodisca vitripennis]